MPPPLNLFVCDASPQHPHRLPGVAPSRHERSRQNYGRGVPPRAASLAALRSAATNGRPCAARSWVGPAKPALCPYMLGRRLARSTWWRRRTMAAFQDLHRDRITGALTMFDRMIFKGHLTSLYKPDGARCFLWTQGVGLKGFTAYAKATTESIANNARKVATDAGRPVISFDHVKTRNRNQPKDDLAKGIAERDGITEGT